MEKRLIGSVYAVWDDGSGGLNLGVHMGTIVTNGENAVSAVLAAQPFPEITL